MTHLILRPAVCLWISVFSVCCHLSTYGQTIESYYSEKGLVVAAFTSDDTGFSGNTTISYLGRDTVCDYPAHTYAVHQSECGRMHLYIEDEKVYVVNYDCSINLYFDYGASVGDTIRASTSTMVVDERSSITLHNGEVRPAILVRALKTQGPGSPMTIVPGIGAMEHGFYLLPPYFLFFGANLEAA